ncbi:MAG: hypothetical protein VXW58_07975, partial [Pseudomonadota bacterium]|nr:hypothetical protein [Pseudomonadota bacterium]
MAKFVLTYGTQGGTVGIEVFKPSSLVAPAQIWLEAVDHAGLAAFEENGSVYNGAHHEYYHEWTINGEPLSEWGKPTNLLAAHNNPNKAFGRKVSFCLPDPGSYVIDLVVTDRMGNTAVASTGTVIVFDPESYFPPADRIYVDPDGDFTGVPAASERVVSLEDLRVTMGSRTVNPTWVLLRRGKEHPLEGVDALNSNDNFKGSLYFDQFNEVKLISGYGSGANPVVTPDSRADRSPNNSMFKLLHPKTGDWRTVSGIDFRGERSAATEHGF